MPTLPTQADVAAVIPQRTGDTSGVVTDTFGATTVPTDTQVSNIIAKLGGEVTAAVGAVPAELEDFWRWVVTLGSAAQVERSFYPDQQSERTDILWDRYKATLDALRKAVAAAAAGSSPAGAEVLPVFGYPELATMPFTTTQTRF